MIKIIRLVFIFGFLYLFNVNFYGQCPPSVNEYYTFDEGNGVTATGFSGGSSISFTNASWIAGIINSGVSFNGTNAKGTLSNNFFNWTANQDYTIEFWVNLKSISTTQSMVFIGRDDPVTPVHWWIGAESVTGKPIMDLRDENGLFAEIKGSSALAINTWYHIGFVRDNTLNENRLYINGLLIGTASVDYAGTFNSAKPVTLGMMNYNNVDQYYSNINMDELVFHHSALSASTIQQHYQDQLGGTPICTMVTPPPDLNPPVKILPLGNSITFEDYVGDVDPPGQRVAYRIHLYNKLTAAGYKFDFVGTEQAGYNLFPDPDCGGFPGINKEQMVTLLNTGFNPRTSTQVTPGPYLNTVQPDVILLHIGTNDLTTDVTAIGQILDAVDAYRTSSGNQVKLVIAKIINRATYHAPTTQYNQNLENAVVAHNHPDNYLVDMENGAGIDYATEMQDNLHPKSAGYDKMASVWYSALTGILDPPSVCNTSFKGFWKMDETSTSLLHDQISSHDAIGNGSAVSVPGIVNNAISFNGVNAEANISNGSDFDWAANGSFSLQFWMKKGSTCSGTTNNVIWGRHDASTQLHWWVGVECSSGNQGKITFNLTAKNGDSQVLTSTSNVINNTWHLVTVARDGSAGTTKIYIDNNLEASGNFTFTDNFSSGEPVNIGWLNTTPYYHLDGVLDEMALYNTALTQADVQSDYVAGLNHFSYCQAAFVKAPGGLTATPSDGTITLQWRDFSTNESGFRIERKTGTGSFAQVGQVGANTTVFVNSGLPSSTTFTYRVYAFNGSVNSAYSYLAAATTPLASNLTNLAPGKPVLQSSTAYGGVATRGNDNNTNGDFSMNSVTHTTNEQSPYWQIDLQAISNIDHIVIWNRTNSCCIGRFVNYYVFVSDVPFTSSNLTNTINQSGVWNSFNSAYPNPSKVIPVNRTGRYVRIQFQDVGEMNLAEAQIFGTTGPPPPPTAPAAPTNLQTTAASSTSVQLTWADNSNNENGFRIERKTGSGSFGQIIQLAANSNSYTDAGLQASTIYTYRVYAYNDIGSSGYSNESTVQTQSGASITNLAPGKPVSQSSTAYAGVAERGNDNNTNGDWSGNSITHTNLETEPWWQINLQSVYNIDHIEVWNRTNSCCVNRMVNYYIFVSDAPFASSDLTSTINQSGVWNSFHANYPNPMTSIPVNRTGQYVRIQLSGQGIINLAEMKIFGSTGGGSTPTPPSAPSGLQAQATSSTAVQLTWTDNSSDENGFRIERKTGSGSFGQIIELANNTTSYSDAGLQEGTAYTYRVYAFNMAGNSGYSNEATATTQTASVTNIAPGKPVSQSSTAYGGVATRGNDNNTDGNWAGNSVTHTLNEQSPWWQIDLQDVNSIDHIEIWNRTNSCCKPRMVNFYLFVSDVPFTSTDLNTTINQSGVWNNFFANYPDPSISVPVNRSGRYVRLQYTGVGEMNLAEMRIFGSSLKGTNSGAANTPDYTDPEMTLYPNPFSEEITIEFNAPDQPKGSLTIFDITGRVQKQLDSKEFITGRNTFVWDGRNTEGRASSAGIYFVKLIVNDKVTVRKVLLAR